MVLRCAIIELGDGDRRLRRDRPVNDLTVRVNNDLRRCLLLVVSLLSSGSVNGDAVKAGSSNVSLKSDDTDDVLELELEVSLDKLVALDTFMLTSSGA
jgi:hypothetical protein